MVKDRPQATATLDELQAKLKAIKTIHASIIGVFVVIILLWIVLGHWRDNLPVFISTIAMAVAISASLVASRSNLNAELKKRKNTESPADIG